MTSAAAHHRTPTPLTGRPWAVRGSSPADVLLGVRVCRVRPSGGVGGGWRSDHTRVMVEAGWIRASDADRDGVLERLRRAHVEGRLDAEELTDRAGTALTARTVGELAALTADLPPVGGPPGQVTVPPAAVAADPGWAVASAGGHRANHAGMIPVAAICFTVGVSVLTGGRLLIWPGWLAFWVVLQLLRRGHSRGCVRAPADRPGHH